MKRPIRFDTESPLESKSKNFNNIKLKYVTVNDEIFIASIDLCSILRLTVSSLDDLPNTQVFKSFIYTEDRLKRRRKQLNQLLTTTAVTKLCNKAQSIDAFIEWLNAEIYGYDAIKLSSNNDPSDNSNTNKYPHININSNENLIIELFHLLRDAFYKSSSSDPCVKNTALKIIDSNIPNLEKIIGKLIEDLY